MKPRFWFYVMMSMPSIWLSTMAAGKEHVVTQKDKQFSVASLDIKVGDSVKFVNADNTTHQIMYKVGDEKKSTMQKSGDPEATAVVQSFGKAENVVVRCAIHPKMKLEINVK